MNTNREAIIDSKTVITTTFNPFFLSVSNWKNSPVENAMNDSAISAMKSIPVMTEEGMALRTYGPSVIPASIYPVTEGSFILFVIRVNRNPMSSIKEMEPMIIETGDEIFNFSKSILNLLIGYGITTFKDDQEK